MRHFFALFVLTAAVPAMAATEVPATPSDWLTRMSDFSQNTQPARDPKVFLGLLNAATEPSFQQVRIDNMTEPALWNRVVRTASSEGAIENMQALATPQTAINWMAAFSDPQFYEAVSTILADPGKQARWAMAPMDANSYQPFEKFASPALYERWEQAATAPVGRLASADAAVAGNVSAKPAFGFPFPFAMMPR